MFYPFSDAMHCIAPRNALQPPTQCIASAPANVCGEKVPSFRNPFPLFFPLKNGFSCNYLQPKSP